VIAPRGKIVGRRLLIVIANLATIAVIVKVAAVSPIRAALIVAACVLVELVLWRRQVADLIHRVSGH
jgi:hypothetical protein